MKLTNLEKQEEQLLSRTKVSCKGEFNAATPSTADIQKAIASQLKCKEDVIVVKGIYTHFGKKTADINALVYNDADSLKQIERIKEEKPKEGEPKKDAPAEKKE